jgi:hypothetical protein
MSFVGGAQGYGDGTMHLEPLPETREALLSLQEV